ncbi:MAG: histidine kinase [Muribaculum sp.]|nr:histidine kinase [Muribaculum sp.]
MKLNTIIPVIYGMALFAVIRLANDMMVGDNYLKHSATFIFIELAGVFIGCYVSFFLFVRFIKYSCDRGVAVWKESVAVLLYSLIVTFSLILTTHDFDADFLRDIIIPMTVVPLMSLWLYSNMKSSYLSTLYDEQRLKNEMMKSERMQSELQMLRAQYHPHFLFNMLNTIYFTIDESNERARDSVEHLANLLRGQLYDGDEKIEIDREISAVRSYVALAGMRFGDKLSLKMNVDPCLTGVTVYPHLFLPLIENAFKHCGGDNSIAVDICAIGGGEVSLTVLNSVGGESHERDGGVGLKNLRRRLDLLYPGSRHKLEIERGDKTFMVTLRLKI